MNLITQAIELVGLQPLAQACGVTYQAVRKWEKRNRLPRTDWTGETNYAAAIEAVTGGAISKKSLLTAVPCAVE
ncbi:YdaS family helix-turn-helix protein [Chromobacterium violaceum]|uniref:YdaS family helix-turn-helix protein n=1 Tax=Chromobacterium violaceum TaxID=536 RepID=UPI0005B854E6|nr:YdaS family helix-turn-helix protein [Chromobacterium violaceum]